jgi:hypothetical protein
MTWPSLGDIRSQNLKVVPVHRHWNILLHTNGECRVSLVLGSER